MKGFIKYLIIKIMKIKIIYCFLLIGNCLFYNCSDKKENMIKKTIYDSVIFSYPTFFEDSSEEIIDSIFYTVIKDGRPHYYFFSDNSNFKFYRYDIDTLGLNINANDIISSIEAQNKNNKASIIELNKDRITISYTYENSTDSLLFDLTSFFIIDDRTYLFDYYTLNSKENIDTITPYKILETIKKM